MRSASNHVTLSAFVKAHANAQDTCPAKSLSHQTRSVPVRVLNRLLCSWLSPQARQLVTRVHHAVTCAEARPTSGDGSLSQMRDQLLHEVRLRLSRPSSYHMAYDALSTIPSRLLGAVSCTSDLPSSLSTPDPTHVQQSQWSLTTSSCPLTSSAVPCLSLAPQEPSAAVL